MTTISMLINGEQTQARSGATFIRANPLDGQVATTAPAATPDDAVAAVDAAAAAFPAWSRTGPGERRALLLAAARALEARAAAFTRAMAAATGAWRGLGEAIPALRAASHGRVMGSLRVLDSYRFTVAVSPTGIAAQFIDRSGNAATLPSFG